MKKIIVTLLTVLTVIGAGVTAYGANTYSASSSIGTCVGSNPSTKVFFDSSDATIELS